MAHKHSDVIHAALIQAAAVLTQTHVANWPVKTDEATLQKFQEMLKGVEQKFNAHIANDHKG